MDLSYRHVGEMPGDVLPCYRCVVGVPDVVDGGVQVGDVGWHSVLHCDVLCFVVAVACYGYGPVDGVAGLGDGHCWLLGNGEMWACFLYFNGFCVFGSVGCTGQRVVHGCTGRVGERRTGADGGDIEGNGDLCSTWEGVEVPGEIIFRLCKRGWRCTGDGCCAGDVGQVCRQLLRHVDVIRVNAAVFDGDGALCFVSAGIDVVDVVLGDEYLPCFKGNNGGVVDLLAGFPVDASPAGGHVVG